MADFFDKLAQAACRKIAPAFKAEDVKQYLTVCMLAASINLNVKKYKGTEDCLIMMCPLEFVPGQDNYWIVENVKHSTGEITIEWRRYNHQLKVVTTVPRTYAATWEGNMEEDVPMRDVTRLVNLFQQICSKECAHLLKNVAQMSPALMYTYVHSNLK
jgi:hypothetical protein